MNLVTILILFFFTSLQAQTDSGYIKTADLMTRTVLTDLSGYRMLEELCKMGPRVSGSDNSLKVIHWGVEKMKEIGLDTIWLQPVTVPHWDPGKKHSARINFRNGKKELAIAPLGGSVPTPDNGITAEVVEVKNFEELKSIKDKIPGKIVFFSRPLDVGLLNPLAGYSGAVNQRSSGGIQASQFGAVAVVIRSITTKHDNNPHTGSMNYVDSIPKIPGAALGYQDADYLSNMLKKDPNLKLTITFDCSIHPDAQSFNVIGEIKGSENPDEIVLVGGHSDSWFLSCGAHDDGAGIIQSIEVFELFKKLKITPKRTIRCVWFINEENGIKGALAYAKYSDSIKIKHVAAIESDLGAFTPEGFSVDSDSVIINKLQSWLPYLRRTGIEYIRKGGSGVDVSRIKDVKAKFGYNSDDQKYMDVQHSANDNFESVHPREFELGTASIAMLVYLLSENGL